MAFPEEDLPQFPVAAAESLAGELDRLAGKLEEMIEARATAGETLTEFEGAVADQFREDLAAHEGDVGDIIERFRRTAGNLRDAVEEHDRARSEMMALGSGTAA